MPEDKEDSITESTEEKSGEFHDDPEQQGAEVMETEDNESEGESAGDALQQQIAFLRTELEESNERSLRIQAEMENLRKRTARDVENAHKYALDRFIKDLLPVIDSLELGISATDNIENIESLREGMDLTLKKFLDTLDKYGVTVVAPEGDKFDPEKHEAVSMLDTGDAESGTVVAVMQKGYELNGRLVRPAMVVVAK